MTRIRTLEFLPEIFQTPTNSQFLAATLDQLVNPPTLQKNQGYIGSRFGYGLNANDYYVTEPTKVRRDYQLEPGVVFTKKDEEVAKDFLSYPGILDAIKLGNGISTDNNRLFESEFYSWDSFTNLDAVINYNEYYWLPEGPPAVQVSSSTVFVAQDYVVTDLPNAYNIKELGAASGTNNPTITLIRGGEYNFYVNQNTNFWIQGEPGVTGYSPSQPNLYTREIFGVTNNGATTGIVTFNVPAANVQDEFDFPGNNPVGVVSTTSFANLNGVKLSSLSNGIDGVTSLNGLTVLFYNTGIPNEVAQVNTFYDQSNYDTNLGFTGGVELINITNTDSSTGLLTANTTANLNVGQTITFNPVTFGNISSYNTTNPNTIYYVSEIDSATTFNITLNTKVNSGSFVVGRRYSISEYDQTNWTSVGATETNAGFFTIGKTYFISEVGTTDFTIIGADDNTVGLAFIATGVGIGTGKAFEQRFTATSTGTTSASHLLLVTLMKYLY